MYGYVRPNIGELRVREYEQFRSVYCGLCETLRRRYGPLARFVVNYDFTFLAMVIMDASASERRRCPVHPLRKRSCVCGCEALDRAADYSVILAWWKLRDGVTDKGFFSAIPSRLGLLLLRRAYRKASAIRPEFAENTRRCLEELSTLEKNKSDSLDRTADCFARILAFAAGSGPEENDRVRRELFYHVGRSVYLLDAADDLPQDMKNKNYNPLRFRFSLSGGAMTEEEMQVVRATLNLSQRCAAAALSLRHEDAWQPILENIIQAGLPAVTSLVLSGKWRDRHTQNKRSDLFPRGADKL